MLGLKRGTVRLCDHDIAWEREAARTMEELKALLGDTVQAIAHVGSTSVQTIKAKPIIDIALAVKALSDIEPYAEVLQAHGYYLRLNALEGQLLLACGSFYEGTGEEQTHFIHVVETDSVQWQEYLLFRDYLRTCPWAAKEYEALKLTLAAKAPIDHGREQYLAGKRDFIADTLRKAKADDRKDEKHG